METAKPAADHYAVALGFITLASALATFISCRSCLSFLGHFGLKSPLETPAYRAFYKYHGYYWSVFLFALVVHLKMAMIHTGLPAAGDPDAPIHWTILSLGLSSIVVVGTVLASCRSVVGLINRLSENRPMKNQKFQVFFRFHSYYWVILILLIAGHFVSDYSHIGFWPG